MFKRPAIIFLSLLSATLLFFACAFVWQTVNASNSEHSNKRLGVSKVDSSWHEGSKMVDLDNYIAKNQVSQNIIDKKQRVMLEPELINFHAAIQAPIQSSQAELVTDSLAVWGISPLPEVAFSTYVRSNDGQVIGVYVENAIASHLSQFYPVDSIIELQAYRLYNYAKGPRLLIVGAKPTTEAISQAFGQQTSNKTEKAG